MVNKFLNKITLVFGFIFISKNLIYPRFFFFKMSEVHLFFFLTKITFKVTVLIILLLFFFFKNKTIKSVLIVLSVYILTNGEFFYKKNIILEPVNIGLFNSLNQYHPPLFIFTTMFYIFCKLNFLKTRNVLNALLITTLLSMWWASQELFWGSY